MCSCQYYSTQLIDKIEHIMDNKIQLKLNSINLITVLSLITVVNCLYMLCIAYTYNFKIKWLKKSFFIHKLFYISASVLNPKSFVNKQWTNQTLFCLRSSELWGSASWDVLWFKCSKLPEWTSATWSGQVGHYNGMFILCLLYTSRCV